MKGCLFNIDNGYLEGLCRGFKCGILQQSDYLNLVQCETLEGNFSHYFVLFYFNIFNFNIFIYKKKEKIIYFFPKNQ